MSSTCRDGRKVAIIGAGRVGTAMSGLLSSRGYDVAAVYDPDAAASERAARLGGARAVGTPGEAAGLSEIILITTPDGVIEEACATLVEDADTLQGRRVVHMSGALSLEALRAARRAGAQTLVVHPIQTFADIDGATRNLPGSTFGVTCEADSREWAERFVDSLSGRVLFVPDEDKVLYHAAAAMACNLMVMVEYGAQIACRALGFPDEASMEALEPLIRVTAENVARLGPVAALTGPLARGDLETLQAHLEALADVDEELARMYRAVSQWGLRLVAEKGELDPEVIDIMEGLLD